jgi:hypothetical protein
VKERLFTAIESGPNWSGSLRQLFPSADEKTRVFWPYRIMFALPEQKEGEA